MLKYFRHKGFQKGIYIFLALAVVITFAISGVILGGRDSGNSSASPGKIDNKNVSLQDYLKSYKAVHHQAAWIYGEKFQEMQGLINFKGEAWDRLLLLNQVKLQKIKIKDDEVVDWLGAQPIFINKGVFDEAFYKRYVSDYLKVSPRDFEEEIRELLAIRKVQQNIRAGIHISEEDLKNFYIQENGQKKIQYAVAPWESAKLEGTEKADDKEINQIYSIMKEKLTEPEKVKLAFLFIPSDKKEALKAAFDEKEATFEALSKKYTLEIKETGYFSKNDAVPEIGLSKEILTQAFTLDVSKESDWISLEKGSYKIKVLDKKAERVLTLEESKAELQKLLNKQKATDVLVKKLNELKKKMETGGFEETLKAEGFEVKTLDNFKKGDYVASVGPSSLLDKKLSDLKEGQISDAFAVPTGAVILKVVKNSRLDEKKFASEKETLRAKLLDKKTEEEMTALLENLHKKLSIDVKTMNKLFAEDK